MVFITVYRFDNNLRFLIEHGFHATLTLFSCKLFAVFCAVRLLIFKLHNIVYASEQNVPESTCHVSVIAPLRCALLQNLPQLAHSATQPPIPAVPARLVIINL